MTKMENALCWLYVKSWNNFGQHVLDEEGLWNFGGEDLEAALMGLAYQRKQDKSERSKELKKLINMMQVQSRQKLMTPVRNLKVLTQKLKLSQRMKRLH